ncbi:MAG: septum formation family protein [Propionibacteriales bacterium]|nr:septum formation family protein [Propionibacteriales bacterium]
MRISITVLATVAALLLAGCAPAAPGPSASTDGSSPLSTLAVGQCTSAIDPQRVPSFTVTDCDDPHAWEVASIVPTSGDAYPGEAALRQLADSTCASALVDYVGVEPMNTAFGVTFMAPNEAHWADAANRKVACLVGAASGGISESLKGTAYSFPTKGQCFGKPAANSFTLELLPCTEAHFYEVYATKKLDGKTPPTAAAFDKAYASACVAGFKDYVGVDVGKSSYEILHFVLPDSLWTKLSDHRLVCSAGSPSGGIAGTLKDAKK